MTEEYLDDYRISTVHVSRTTRLADCTVRTALWHGVTASISAGVDYSIDSQPYAQAFLTAGFGGIKYRARRDLEGGLISIALFGNAGEDRSRPVDATERIPLNVLDEADFEFGIRVLPRAELDPDEAE
jgi:hypothetical protein